MENKIQSSTSVSLLCLQCNYSSGDGATYRDVLIECNVIPALLSRLSPDTPVSFMQALFVCPLFLITSKYSGFEIVLHLVESRFSFALKPVMIWQCG